MPISEVILPTLSPPPSSSIPTAPPHVPSSRGLSGSKRRQPRVPSRSRCDVLTSSATAMTAERPLLSSRAPDARRSLLVPAVRVPRGPVYTTLTLHSTVVMVSSRYLRSADCDMHTDCTSWCHSVHYRVLLYGAGCDVRRAVKQWTLHIVSPSYTATHCQFSYFRGH